MMKAVAVGAKFAGRAGFVLAVTGLAWFRIPAAVIAIVASILVALQAKAATLIEISFGPLKAKLEREVSEAERLIGQLRELAALQAKAVIAAGVRTGRFATEDGWLYDHVKDLEASLRAMGLPEEALREARKEFVTYAINDAGSMALGHGHIPSKDGQLLEQDWRDALGTFPHRDPDKIEAFLTTHGLLSDERAKVLDDMRWMMEHGDVRDAEQYVRTQKPMPWPG